MKRLFSVLFVVLLLSGVSIAEEKSITWHSVFGLTEGATEEQISKSIQSVFQVPPSASNPLYFYPEYKYFYGLPVRWVIMTASDTLFSLRSFEIRLEDDCLTAENVFSLYMHLCDEFGDPAVCKITRKDITVKGSRKIDIDITDLSAMQLAIDQLTIDGLICWDNISLAFRSYSYDSEPTKSLVFSAAFSEASLEREIRDLYGITR